MINHYSTRNLQICSVFGKIQKLECELHQQRPVRKRAETKMNQLFVKLNQLAEAKNPNFNRTKTYLAGKEKIRQRMEEKTGKLQKKLPPKRVMGGTRLPEYIEFKKPGQLIGQKPNKLVYDKVNKVYKNEVGLSKWQGIVTKEIGPQRKEDRRNQTVKSLPALRATLSRETGKIDYQREIARYHTLLGSPAAPKAKTGLRNYYKPSVN